MTLPATRYWYDIDYGAGKFVAYGSKHIAYSSDGVNWSEVALDTDYDFQRLTYCGDTFIMVTSTNTGITLYSKDGLTWEEGKVATGTQSDASYFWSDMAYGGGKTVMVSPYTGAMDVIAYSENTFNITDALKNYNGDLLSIPASQINGGVTIETASYVGTGTTSLNQSFTFSGKPIFLHLTLIRNDNVGGYFNYSEVFLNVKALETQYEKYGTMQASYDINGSMYYIKTELSADKKTITLKTGGSSISYDYQALNYSGYTYQITAICY